ncbi:uncharacterized protein LOC107611447 [Arachis ipaensis]|uniref:uncharacterized protein LOC107611447 n=1 Tax=Arachis ipaensis TaxID=130454 RepID=UPI0007AFAB24|nr:uncharacterized protein LOC107611447 [Arachis ipaensis]
MDQGICQVLQKPDLAGRMMTWAIELSQYDLRYESRHAIKAQAMADFLVEVAGDPTEEAGTRWRLHVDGASNQTSGGAGIILESPAEVITRFGIPKVVISDNGTQFTDKKFVEFLTDLGIKQKFSSVEHPQTNGQVEAANKVVLLGLKKRLDNKKGALADELASVLWSYRTTEQSSTGETPFRLTYGVDAMIPVEIGEPSPRLLLNGVEEAVEKDLVDETREMTHFSEVALKQRMTLRYNTKVLRREFEQNDLVLRRNDIGLPTQGEGKLAANWEGPYKVKEVIGKGAYKLEKLDGKEIPRTWNVGNLRRFYS